MSKYKTLDIEKKENGLVLWLNQPEKRNAISNLMIEELTDFFTSPAGENHFVIIAGHGECFAAGADLKEMSNISETKALETSRYLHRLHKHISKYNAVVVSAVHGYAIGGGFELALGSDMVYATPEAWFQLPEMAFSLIPGGGATQLLPKIIGRGSAMHAIFTGKKFTIDEALRLGLVQDTFDEENLIPQIVDQINAITSKTGKDAVVALKKAIRPAMHEDGFAVEAEGFAWLLTHKAKPFIEDFINKQ